MNAVKLAKTENILEPIDLLHRSRRAEKKIVYPKCIPKRPETHALRLLVMQVSDSFPVANRAFVLNSFHSSQPSRSD